MGLATLGCAVLAQDVPLGPGIYSCTDARGRRLTADRPIAECVDRDQRVLGNSGVELRRVGPTLTDNERAELDAQRRRDQAEQRRMREERSRDKALITRYPNQAAHDAEHGARDDRIREQRDERAVVLEREDVAPVDRGDDAGDDVHAAPPWS